MKKVIAIIASVIALSLFSARILAKETCDYQSIKGEEFFFPESKDYLYSQSYSFWYKQPAMMQYAPLPQKEYVGKRGKLVGVTNRNNDSVSSFKVAILENCEKVYAQVPWGPMRGSIVTYQSDIEEAKTLIGKKVTVKNARIEKNSLKSLDGNAKYDLAHLEQVTVIDLQLVRVPQMRDEGTFYLVVKKDNGQVGYLGYSDKYLFMENESKI